MRVDVDIPPHGGQLRRIAEQFGVPVAGLLDFSANINPEDPSSSVVQALHKALGDPTVLSRYPDLEETQLRLSISSHSSVAHETIVVANGFVPLLDAVLGALPIRRCLLPVPAFGEYRKAFERAGVEVTPYVLDQANDFRYSLGNLVETLAAGNYDAILLANPQNPSGVLCEQVDLVTVVEAALKLNIYILLDEAFIDYAPAQSLVSGIERFSNLIVFRSVTKFHGCPGLRVAYLVARSALTRTIQQNLPPWSITTLAAIAVSAALGDSIYANRTLLLNQARRESLAAEIRALGFYVYPGAANFLLIRFQSSEDAGNCWEQLIRNHSIVLRHCKTFEALSDDHLRCAVRGEEENIRLVRALDRYRNIRSATS